MIPMGTVVTVCMILGVLFGLPLEFIKRLPMWLRGPLAAVVFAAGAWNVFWYGLQHFTEHWGIAALLSGLLMMLMATHIAADSKLPAIVRTARPVTVLLLLGFAFYYGWTIYNL